MTDLFSLSSCNKGLGRVFYNACPSFTFDQSSAMLALLFKIKFYAKDIILSGSVAFWSR